MVEPCDRILSATTLYEVLELETTCTNEEIKKSYRKIAIQVHPDRCKHPRSTEAFQKVSHAYQTLSDEDKRAAYDRYGDDPPRQEPQFHGGQQFYQAYHQGPYGAYYTFNDEMTADEIFNMFFGGMQQDFVYQRRYQRRQPEPVSNWTLLLRMLIPMILIFFVMGGPMIQKLFNPHSEFEEHITFDSVYKADKRFREFRSTKYGKPFFCKVDWLRSKIKNHNRAFYEELRSEADHIYETQIKQKCQYERTMRQREKPACEEMRKYHIYM